MAPVPAVVALILVNGNLGRRIWPASPQPTLSSSYARPGQARRHLVLVLCRHSMPMRICVGISSACRRHAVARRSHAGRATSPVRGHLHATSEWPDRSRTDATRTLACQSSPPRELLSSVRDKIREKKPYDYVDCYLFATIYCYFAIIVQVQLTCSS